MTTDTPTPDLLRTMDVCWRAAYCLPVGQLNLCDNPLLKPPLMVWQYLLQSHANGGET